MTPARTPSRDLIADETLKLIVFQAVQEEIEQWIE